MRNFILLVALLFYLKGISQDDMTNKEPVVSIDGYKTLFIGIDNPITISTGQFSHVRVGFNNGTIRQIGAGHYAISPRMESDTAILRLKTGNKTYQFIYKVRSLPDPALMLAGDRNEEGVITNFKTTRGVYAYLKNFYYETQFNIVSFDITFSGEGFDDIVTHKNNGAAWDNETQKLINRCRIGSEILINHVYVIDPGGRTRKLWDEIKYILR